jgi:hypothetical protein
VNEAVSIELLNHTVSGLNISPLPDSDSVTSDSGATDTDTDCSPVLPPSTVVVGNVGSEKVPRHMKVLELGVE